MGQRRVSITIPWVGGGPGATPWTPWSALRLWGWLRRFPFEWETGAGLSLAVWVFLGAAVAMPFPLHQWPIPERATPIMWLLLGGAVCLLGRIARASWPFAALMAWALVRAGFMAFPLRALQCLLLMGLGGLLYVAARELPERMARFVAFSMLAGIGYEWFFGLINLMGIYPYMTFVQPEYIGRPMGYLTHTNYWGSFAALGLPLVWSQWGLIAAVALYALIGMGISGGPIVSASVGMALMAWPSLSRRLRWALLVGCGVATSVVLTLHEWRLSGRREVWAAIWPELMRYPLIGQGLGSWRIWAEQYNAKLSAQLGGVPTAFATLQAHNEAYQLWFELGLIGLLCGTLWLLQVAVSAGRIWWHCPAGNGDWWRPGHVPLERAWVALAAVAVVNSFVSPTFHLPGQAALVLFALGRLQARAATFPAEVPPLNGRSGRSARIRSPEYAETCRS